ncbi:DUF5667 domain-containing protein [Methanocella conradii]|uniref:DUF5667 domain-containing protein n=1 Tax=Methanocella conradii TaxID=1175444 RepID=UPI00157C6C0C|nr:DUF5667 domain-containing protein [Methanocella conradii]
MEVVKMMKKIIAATLALAVLAALVPAAMADQGDIKPYKGWIGADSPLYPIKIFLQKLDVSLTFNNNEKMKKQMAYLDERASEIKAMELANNAEALEAALEEYEAGLNELNNTTQAPDINETDYAALEPLLYHHQQCFYGMMNNSTMPLRTQERLRYMFNETVRVRNGMPFYYYNNTSYFIPPGQMKKVENGIDNDDIINGSKVPPGLAKKGYVGPVPTITNGSKSWPWDEINYTSTTPNASHMKNQNNNKNENEYGNYKNENEYGNYKNENKYGNFKK